MLPDRESNPGPLAYESGALPIALRGPATSIKGNCCFTKRFGQQIDLEQKWWTIFFRTYMESKKVWK